MKKFDPKDDDPKRREAFCGMDERMREIVKQHCPEACKDELAAKYGRPFVPLTTDPRADIKE